MQDSKPFRILMVCTGNVCRSPMAERVLQSGLDRLAPGLFQVSSAGTGALSGSDMVPQVAGFVRVLGGDAERFTARQLTADILKQQDLVLTMTRQQRSAVVMIAPSLLRRTFTVREFARVLDVSAPQEGLDPHQRWTSTVAKAARLRSQVVATAEDDDIVDPYRQSDDVYQQMVEQLTPALHRILGWEAENHR